MDDPREKLLKQMQTDYPYTPARDELIQDDIRTESGLPLRARDAAAGVADMQQRLELLRDDKRKLLDAMDTAKGAKLIEFKFSLAKLNQSIDDTERRLAEYRTQGEGLN